MTSNIHTLSLIYIHLIVLHNKYHHQLCVGLTSNHIALGRLQINFQSLTSRILEGDHSSLHQDCWNQRDEMHVEMSTSSWCGSSVWFISVLPPSQKCSPSTKSECKMVNTDECMEYSKLWPLASVHVENTKYKIEHYTIQKFTNECMEYSKLRRASSLKTDKAFKRPSAQSAHSALLDLLCCHMCLILFQPNTCVCYFGTKCTVPCVIFSCPGSSIPTFGTGATLEIGHKEWLLRLQTLQAHRNTLYSWFQIHMFLFQQLQPMMIELITDPLTDYDADLRTILQLIDEK